MKNLSKLTILVIMVVFASCKDTKTEDRTITTTTSESDTTEQLYSCSMHPEVIGKKGDSCSKCGMELTVPVKQTQTSDEKVSIETAIDNKNSNVISEIVSNYLKLKNALVKGDSNVAASAGKAVYATFDTANTAKLDAKLKKQYLDIAEDAKEHAEHIGSNGGKIDHQREHFVMLSKDINDLIKAFGTNKKLYQEFCPMANDGKGAVWISEFKDIKNPYYGAEMLSCGSVQKEY